jgi:hypothetical protein
MIKGTLSELRRALKNVPSGELPEICLRLARYKKENKELLCYLLFEADDEPQFIRNVKNEIDLYFGELIWSTPYLTKKRLRKVLTFTNQRIRYSGKRRTEAELLIYFCKKFRKEAPFQNNISIRNLYQRQVQRVKKAIAMLHEDLQFDYSEDIKLLE